MIRNLFIPTSKNNYTPTLLHRNAMVIYVIVILVFNTLIPNLGIGSVGADITLEELLLSHNQERAEQGLNPLTLNTTLSKSAGDKAQAMLESDCWSHYCPPGTEPWNYFKEAGYNYQHAGENLAEGFTSIDSVMSAWMNSPSHRENILNGDFEEVGFGFAYGNYQGKDNNTIIAVHFGTKFKPKPVIQEPPTITTEQPNNILPTTNQQEPSINIENINNDQYINKNYIEVTGKVVPSNSSVGIILNDDEIGRVNASGENYTYRSESEYEDGKYFISANLYGTNGEFIKQSEVISFYLDGNYPEIDKTSVNVNKVDESLFTIDFSTSEDVIKINSNLNYEALLKDEEVNRWFITYNITELNSYDNLNLELIDSVGNISQFVVSLTEIFDVLYELDLDDSSIEENDESILFLSEFISRIKSGGIRSIVPIVFSLYLLTLFIIDFTILAKTNMLHMVRRNSHLNVAVILILLIVFSFGSLTGSILTNGIEVSATL